MSSYKPRHLVACDKDDLKVISAMMQDCIINASDMVFDKSMRLFAVMGNRFCWEVEDKNAPVSYTHLTLPTSVIV